MSLRRFEYNDRLPYIPLPLSYAEHTIQREALIDSGATHSLMPYHVGLDLGLSWEEQTLNLPAEEAFRGIPAVGIRVLGMVKAFPPIPLVFAWWKSDDSPLILGHINFFRAFEVHFYSKKLLGTSPPGKFGMVPLPEG
jgi:hypothetical protein